MVYNVHNACMCKLRKELPPANLAAVTCDSWSGMTGKLVPGSIIVCSMGSSTARGVKITGVCCSPVLQDGVGRRRLASLSGLPDSAARRPNFFGSYCKWSLVWEGVSHVTTFDLDLYLQGYSAMNLDKLLKYVTSCCVRSTVHTILDGTFLYLAQMSTSMRVCVMCNDLWAWPISSRSFHHNFAIKLLKYGTSCHVSSTACEVLDNKFSNWHKWTLAWEGVSVGQR